MTYALLRIGRSGDRGGLAAWLIASTRVAKSLTAKVVESERRANVAEGLASGLETTVAELRGQNQKTFQKDSLVCRPEPQGLARYQCGDWRS